MPVPISLRLGQDFSTHSLDYRVTCVRQGLLGTYVSSTMHLDGILAPPERTSISLRNEAKEFTEPAKSGLKQSYKKVSVILNKMYHWLLSSPDARSIETFPNDLHMDRFNSTFHPRLVSLTVTWRCPAAVELTIATAPVYSIHPPG